MHPSYATRPFIEHRRSRTQLTLVDDPAAHAAHTSPQDSKRPPEQLPRATVLHGVLMGITAAVAVWFVVDLVNAIGDPDVISGHLRGALVAAIVILAVTMSNWRLYRRVERLHSRWRDTTEWWAKRAAVIDRRDEEFRACQEALTEGQRVFIEGQRALAEDMRLVGRGVVDLYRGMPAISSGVGQVNATLHTIGRQVVGIGGGQAIMNGTVEHIAAAVAQLVARQRHVTAAGASEGEGEASGDDDWRMYLRGYKDADDFKHGG